MAAAATRTPYGPKSEVAYADPGYQADKKARYPLDSKAHAKSAWAYINQADNAKLYTGPQLKRIKGRIKSALKKFGVGFMAEGWCIDPPLLITEAIAEYAGMDPECAGSYSLSATNGPTTVTVCSYGLDPADLQLILAQACKGAGMALCALDPDMDADIDVPGTDAEDDDGDADALAARIAAALRGESADDPAAIVAEAMAARNAAAETAAPADPAPDPAAATQEMEAPMPETPTTEAAGAVTAATFTQADVDAAAARAVAQAEEARRARKAAKRAAAPAEAAPAAPAAVTESDDERIARLVREGIAAELAKAPAESDEEKVARLVREGITAAKQDFAESGGVARKGLVAEHAGAAASSGEVPADFPMRDGRMIPSEEWTEPQRRAVGAQLERYVLGSRASS